MSELDLEAIDKREAAATPGPWVWFNDDNRNMGCGDVYTADEYLWGGAIAQPAGDCYPRSGYAPAEDMQFIAHARQDIPAMSARIKELEAKLAEKCDGTRIRKVKAVEDPVLLHWNCQCHAEAVGNEQASH